MSDEAMNDTQDLDDLIDRAVASYAPREPRPGLEGRVLAAVAEESRSAARVGRRAGRMVWPEFDGGWMSILERRPVRLAIAAALLLAVVAVPVRLLTHHRDATVVRLAAGTGVGHGLRLKQAISPPPVGEVAATRLHAGGVERPQEPRSTHKLRQDREPGGQESMAFAPIEFKPITIAPISIRALN